MRAAVVEKDGVSEQAGDDRSRPKDLSVEFPGVSSARHLLGMPWLLKSSVPTLYTPE